MLIGSHNYERTFRDIQLSLQSSDEKNVIICASTAECDSVCGVRILQASSTSLVCKTLQLLSSAVAQHNVRVFVSEGSNMAISLLCSTC